MYVILLTLKYLHNLFFVQRTAYLTFKKDANKVVLRNKQTN